MTDQFVDAAAVAAGSVDGLTWPGLSGVEPPVTVRRRFDVAAQSSSLSGKQFAGRLVLAGVSDREFASVFGVPITCIRRVLASDLDGRVSLMLEVALEYVER